MKNLLLLALMAFIFFACSEDQDITGVDQAELQAIGTLAADGAKGDAFDAFAKNANNSASDPIVVPAGTLIDHVLYTRDICTFQFGVGDVIVESVRTRFQGIFFGSSLGAVRSRWVPSETEDCLVNDQSAVTVTEFELGTFYEISGVVVQLSGPSFLDFWVRTDPATGNAQRVNFFEDGSVEFADFVDAPDGDGDGDADTVDCAGVPDFVRGDRYRRGDQVISNGLLYTRTQNGRRTSNSINDGGWSVVGECG